MNKSVVLSTLLFMSLLCFWDNNFSAHLTSLGEIVDVEGPYEVKCVTGLEDVEIMATVRE